MTTTRSSDGTRTGFGSLAAGGLNWDSLPLRLFSGGNAKFWNPADIDFRTDVEDWQSLTDDERYLATILCAQFIAGEEAVTQDLQPFMGAMAAEGRLADEMYLTQFTFEEAKHVAAFRLWLDAVGLKTDLHQFVEFNDGYKTIFYDELPKRLNALTADHSPQAQIRASVTYNHVVEGMLALTGYYAWNKLCRAKGILPGMQEIVKRIGDDERRHMAWGTFTCRRHVAADDTMWDVVQDQMQRLMEPALALVRAPWDAFPEKMAAADDYIDSEEMVAYAFNRGSRRLDTISSARGADVREIDLDYTPAELEEQFHTEDQAELP